MHRATPTLSPSRARKGEHILAITVRFKGKDQRENRPPFGRGSGECFYRIWLDFCSTQNPVRMFKNKSEFAKLFFGYIPASGLDTGRQELALE